MAAVAPRLLPGAGIGAIGEAGPAVAAAGPAAVGVATVGGLVVLVNGPLGGPHEHAHAQAWNAAHGHPIVGSYTPNIGATTTAIGAGAAGAGAGAAGASSTAGTVSGGIAIDERAKYPQAALTKEGKVALADLNNCFPDNKSFDGDSRKAMDALTQAMQPQPGEEVHHVVEQNQTTRFGTQSIQTTSNAINLPKDIHTEVGRIYSSKPLPGTPAAEAGFSTFRKYVQSLPYDEQREVGIKQVRQAMKNLAQNDPAVNQRLRQV